MLRLVTLCTALVGLCALVAAGSSSPLFQYGGMRETLAMKNHQARVTLREITADDHVFAVGALDGLAGEITIVDSEAVTTGVGSDGTLVALDPSDRAATMLVGAEVDVWMELELDAPIAAADFDDAIRDLAATHGLDPATPFPFVVEGTFVDVKLHVIHGACPVHARMHDIELADDARPFEMKTARIEGIVVGVYAENAVGTLTHPDTSVHAHLVFVDPVTGDRITGHLEDRGIAAGSKIRVPRAPATGR